MLFFHFSVKSPDFVKPRFWILFAFFGFLKVKNENTTNSLIFVRKNFQFEKNAGTRYCCHAKKSKFLEICDVQSNRRRNKSNLIVFPSKKAQKWSLYQ